MIHSVYRQTLRTANRCTHGCHRGQWVANIRNYASHHDTHALPPQFILDAYRHYNTAKRVDIDIDTAVIDFEKGLNDVQRDLMLPVGTISAEVIRNACEQYQRAAYPHHASHLRDAVIEDVTIYEHQLFPGLQVVPRLLPRATQSAFLSQIMHDCLANSQHKTNLQTDYDLKYPAQTQSDHVKLSLFAYRPVDVHTTPKDSQHAPLNMQQYLSKRLRWLTIGSQYDWPTRKYSGQDPTVFPSDLANLVSSFFPHIKSESGVCLLYGAKDYMPVHRDVSEQCERALASFSFGCDGIFLVARGEENTDDPQERERRIVAIRVHSGDCVHLAGESRWAWHAMARTISNTCPEHLADWPAGSHAMAADAKVYDRWKGFMNSKRLNVSCRQVWD